MLYTTISILSVLVVALSFAIYNLLQKLEKYEDIIEENDIFLQTELERNEALLEALREIDTRQMFEKDDEVGSIFYQIKETIEKFKTKQNASN
jgi:predicted Holliday junction resolvase-like endonuclease